MGWKNRIVQDERVHFGKPVVEGTRVTVSAIVGAIASGDAIDQVAKDYGISREDVHEAINFALEQVREIFHALQTAPIYRVVRKFGKRQTQKVLRLSLGRERELKELLEVLSDKGLEAATGRFNDNILREVLRVAADVCEDLALQVAMRS